MKLLIHSQTSTVVSFKFGNGLVVSSHTLLDIWLLIHSGIKVNPQKAAVLYSTKFPWFCCVLLIILSGVGGVVRFLVVGTIGKGERPPRSQLWMEQYLISIKYWPILYTIWADPNYIWDLAILADSLLYSVSNILVGLCLNCISSIEITLFWLTYYCSIGPCFSFRV